MKHNLFVTLLTVLLAALILIALPLALAMIYRFAQEPRGPVFNRILVQTAQVEFVFSVLLSIGLSM